MKGAIEETTRRRAVQEKYNAEHGIVPTTVVRSIMNINPASGTIDYLNVPKLPRGEHEGSGEAANDIEDRIAALRLEMFTAAEDLDFEKAARLRDELRRLQGLAGVSSNDSQPPAATFDPYAGGKKAKRGMVKAKAKRGTVKDTSAPPSPSRNGRRYKVR
jgi:excinuclease ABC subunit B